MKTLVGIVLLMVLLPLLAAAHGVSESDAKFVQANQGAAIGPFMYLGAKHMVTGYDHLLFLVGVIFFLYKLKDVVTYVSLFTIGHSVTLLGGVLGGIQANPYLIDAVIGMSVVYKAFDNMDGFKRFLGFQPNTKAAVLIFGLFHGFGLATKLQEFALPQEGLVANIVSFNVGVEIGQALALMGILIVLTYWRQREGFMRHAFTTNTLLMVGGFLLVGFQLAGYFTTRVPAVEAAVQAPAAGPNAAASNKSQAAIFKSDVRDIKLTPGEGIELKYHMPKDGALVYSWKSTGLVQFEFHGEPDVKPDPKYYDSYEINDKEGKTEGHGSFIAPSTGIHGWYWKNIGTQDVTVHVKAAGFFDGIKFFSKAGVQELPAQDAK